MPRRPARLQKSISESVPTFEAKGPFHEPNFLNAISNVVSLVGPGTASGARQSGNVFTTRGTDRVCNCVDVVRIDQLSATFLKYSVTSWSPKSANKIETTDGLFSERLARASFRLAIRSLSKSIRPSLAFASNEACSVATGMGT